MSLALRSYPTDLAATQSDATSVLDDGRRAGKWHLACSTLVLVIGVAAVLFALLARLTSVGTSIAPQATSLHALTLSLLVWVPGLSFSVGPLMFTSAWTSRELRARWVSLGLYSVGSLLLVGSEILSRQPHGMRFYLRYYEAGYRFALGQSCGLATVAVALAVNGWLWLSLAKRSQSQAQSSPLLANLGMAGFVHLILAPVALALPILMAYERIRGVGVFLPQLGGDPSLLPGLFWLYVQPLMLVAVLPVLGLVDELLVRSSRDSHGPRILPMTMGVSICTLMLFSWGNRPEVILSEPARSFFTFTALLTLMLIGQVTLAACFALHRWRSSGWSSSLASFAVATLAMGILLLLPLVLPATSMRWTGTLIEIAQLHLLALGASVLPMVLAVRGLRDASMRGDQAAGGPSDSFTVADEGDVALPRAHSA